MPGEQFAGEPVPFTVVLLVVVAPLLGEVADVADEKQEDLQRWAWFFPMPGTLTKCARLGSYAALQAQATLGDLASHDSTVVAYAQSDQSEHAVNDCLASTTTLWLPVYASAAALLAALGTWLVGRTHGLR
ncbi:hypothetical protein [Streptomyces collinus]|uniref:hypothetical protein n=1 Tax=Streptomyces collinus TaxID=42684 RepID=UPI003681B4DE